MPRVTPNRRLYPDDAKVELGQFFCKHCDSVFSSKYTFSRHITSTLSSPQHSQKDDDITIQIVSEQYNKWVKLNEAIPNHCSTCFTQFYNRVAKYRHVCDENVNENNKKVIQQLLNDEKYALDLLNGRVSDRIFSKHLTFGDVFYHYGEQVFLDAIQKQSLCPIALQVFVNPKHNSLYVVRYEKEDRTFLICEYESWKPAKTDFVITTLFENCISLIRSAYCGATRSKVLEFVTSRNIKLRTEFWLEDLEGNSPDMIRKEKDLILNLFTEQ